MFAGVGRLIGTTAFKLSLVYMVASALFAGGLITYVGWHARRLIDEQIGQTLTGQINALADQYRLGGVRRLAGVIDRRTREPGAFLFLLQGPQGETLAGNISGVRADSFQTGVTLETVYQRLEEEGQQRSALVRSFQLPGGNRLLVGRDLEERDRLNSVLNQAIRILIGALLVFGVLGAFFVARRAIARMDAMTASGQTIMEGDLTQRLPVSGSGDEIDRLAVSLNAMLDRISLLMQGMKEVSDNIAHDLKTPLTRLRSSAEQALRNGRTREEYQAALERTIDESDGLIRIFNALLLIARAEAGSGADAFREVNVSELLSDLAEMYEPSAEEAGARLLVDVPPGLGAQGNRELLGQVVANLLDNALKYGLPPAAGATPEIRLAARRDGEHLTISVADHGEGVPEADRGKVIERFHRLDASRNKPGSGLGLSLAAAVARLHKGTLRLDGNDPGLKVTLELPIAPLASPGN
jgi:signal transduction histidine kinase